MPYNSKEVSEIGTILLLIVLINAVVLQTGITTNEHWYALLVVTVPLLLIALLLFLDRYMK